MPADYGTYRIQLLLLDNLADPHSNIHHTGSSRYLVEDHKSVDGCIDQARNLPQALPSYFY